MFEIVLGIAILVCVCAWTGLIVMLCLLMWKDFKR